MIAEEQIIKVVKVFGNGAHIFVPKEWAGEQIVLVRPKKKSLKDKIIEVLSPYLDSIAGVYLYGSYARSEQTENSDIDLFVVTNKKIKIKEKGFEIISLEQEEIENAIKLEPLLVYSILSEAQVIINSELLEKLKIEHKPKLADFGSFFKDSERMIKVNKDFIDAEKGEHISTEAVIYSLVLRLRGLFIVKCLLVNRVYNHKSFKEWISCKMKNIDFDSIYDAYKCSKRDSKIRFKIKVKDIRLLLKFLENELFMLQYGKKGEKA